MISNFKEILKEIPANPIVETIQATFNNDIAIFNLPNKDNFYLYIF